MKRKLFFLLALMLGLTSSIKAGTDVTSTYLTNADFSVGTPIDNHVCTYGKDMEANNTIYYSAQPISGWTNASVGAIDGGYPNCKLAGAIFAYGGTPWLAGSGTTAPATDPKGNAGNAAGLCAVWGGTIRYTQDVTLPAGNYTIQFQVYNSTTNNGSGKLIAANYFGFDANEGDDYYSPAKTFAMGKWTTVSVTFTLTAATPGKISMGYNAENSGNAAMPHLFVDNVKILSNADNTDYTSYVGLKAAKNEANPDWINSTDGSQGSFTTDDGRSAGCAARYGTSAVANDVIYQDVTGLPEGNYEVEVYAMSQNEWNKHGASLNNDKGDAIYVFAKGLSTIKTYINARRGPGLDTNGGPQVYNISGVVTEDGNIRLGLGIDIANQTEWHMIQIKSLKRVGSALEGLVNTYEETLYSAKQLAGTTERIAATVLANLNTTIDTYDEGKVDKGNKDALTAAINALNTAIDNANTSIASYAVIAAGTVPDNSLVGWTCETFVPGQDVRWQVNTWSSEGDSDGSNMKTPFLENWTPNGNLLGEGRVYYELTGLEPGEVYYAQALVRSYNEASSDAPNGPNFFINDEIVNMSDVGTTFTYNNMSGIYATLGGAATVGEDGTLTLGVSIAENRNYNWVAFKSISIQPMDNAFNAAVAEVTGLEGTIPTAAYNKAYAVVQKWLDDYPTTVAGFESAIAEIGAAADEAKTCVAPYAEYNKKHAAVLALYNVDEYDELVSGAHDALGTALSTAATNVNNAEDADDINNVTDALKEAGATYAGNANPTNENKPFNLTFMLTNPDLTGLPTWAPAAGWYTEQTGGNSQVMTNEGAAGPHGDAFYEYWSEVAAANDKFTLYQKVTLPAGTYTMKCDAFSSQATGGDNCAVYFYANDTQGDLVHNYPMQAKTLSFVNSSEQEVKIGLKALSGNTYRWMGIGYVELYKVPAQVFVISENADYDNTQSGAGDVTLTRTIKVGLNTLVLPFSMTQTEVEANFGADSKVYVVNSYDSNNDNIKFDEHDGISANMPCLLKATVAGTAYNIEGRTIVAGEPTVAGTNVSMTGSYAASITIPYNNYVISGGSIYLVDSDVTMKGTRAYISITGGNNARELILNLDGEVTAINAIEEADAEAEGLKDGKYLIGGKIVIVNNGVKYSANGQILK